MKSLYLFLAISIFFISCSKPGEYRNMGGPAQGSSFSITYEAVDDADYSTEIDSLFKMIDRSMSLWDSTSLISAINRNDLSQPIDEHFKKVLEESIKIKTETDGYMDVTVGPLVKAWGFVKKKNLPPPTPSQVDSLKSLIGKVGIDASGKFFKEKPEIQIDFNSIAQGYTVDLLAGFLESKGIKNYLVEVGGEVFGKGLNAEGENWKVGIEKPDLKSEKLEAVVKIDGKGMSTSGSYRNFLIKDGKKYSHAIDPHTGYPVQHNLLSVTVLADNCLMSDAYDTALLVMGLEKAKAFAAKRGIEFYAIYDQDGQYQHYYTDGFKKYIQD